MLSGMEIWPLFVHSTHRLPEIGIILEIDILRAGDISKTMIFSDILNILYCSFTPPAACLYIGIILEIDI